MKWYFLLILLCGCLSALIAPAPQVERVAIQRRPQLRALRWQVGRVAVGVAVSW